MLKLEDVAIPMSKNSLDSEASLKCLFPTLNESEFYEELENLKKLPALKIFDENVCDFLHKLSMLIMSDTEAKGYPDIITFGFFIRKANLEKLKQAYKDSLHKRIGRGLSFHIAPSNVPINFAYSLVSGLLSGNVCVVRVSSKEFQQTQILCRIFEALNQHKAAKYIKIIQYPHSLDINNLLSSLADVRIIWGGDSTIENLRQSPIKPRCVELCFANRYSICVINSRALLELNDSGLKDLAQGFYNDTYLYDQNACSSPRLIYWLGTDDAPKAKERFWSYVWENVREKYELVNLAVIDKLMTECNASISLQGAIIEKKRDNIISRIYVPKLNSEIEKYECACGSFIESSGDYLDDLLSIASQRFQTLSYFGLDSETICEQIVKLGILGIDRIVPIGKTSDFTLTWDGYDLINTMSRVIDVR